ncbi:MAG: hypothetical protein LBQ87_09595 [Candidatus Fibromonas sp.]|jgi:hypothetical protein|nr:hypothetical protein [Candidatus Fibromonas sp.]
MENRIEEFVRDGKNFIYFDLSETKSNDDYVAIIKPAKECIVKYSSPVLTITNIKDVWFDSETKAIVAEWMKFNEPYVKCGTVIGFDIKRMIVNSIFKLSGRTNMAFVPDKEQAIEWLLKNSP